MAEDNLTPTSAPSNFGDNGSDLLTGTESSGFGGGLFSDPLAPDEGYEYNFAESELPMRTPFDDLIGLPGIDNIADIFGDADMGDNPFAGDEMPSGESLDTGVGNTDNGSGNNFVGDSEGKSGSNNTADGNGNWFYGNGNQAEGNGNWNLGEGNQTKGNGNWNLSGEGNPVNEPLSGAGFDGSTEGFADSNNPVLSGGSTTPTPVGDEEMPDTAENPTGNDNVINGNGNWNFGSKNEISGNGNWSFGDGNVIDNGNGNWSLGDNNQVSGNGNRPSGDDNEISGNSNRIKGNDNSVFGNRFNLDDDDVKVYGNGDRYFIEDEDGNVALISDESASDPNMSFDFENIEWTSTDQRDIASDYQRDELLDNGTSGNGSVTESEELDLMYSSEGIGDGGLPSNNSAFDPLGAGAGGTFLAGQVPEGLSLEELAVA